MSIPAAIPLVSGKHRNRALAAARNWTGSQALTDVIEALTVPGPRGGMRRLRAPRYAIDYLHQRFGNQNANYAISVFPLDGLGAEDDPVTQRRIELIEALWQPGVAGPMSTRDGVLTAVDGILAEAA